VLLVSLFINPKSWVGNVEVGNVDVIKEWENGCNDANQLLVTNFGIDAKVDFHSLFSESDIDLL